MTDPELIAGLKLVVREFAGGFWRNPVLAGTCERCFTPTRPGPLCPPCRRDLDLNRGPDHLGFMTYAGYMDPIGQSGRVMRAYKSPAVPRGAAHRDVTFLTALGARAHTACVGALSGSIVTAWATVPSLPPRSGAHPLNELVRGLARSEAAEVVLEGSQTSDPRSYDPDHFRVVAGNVTGQHVLLIDDTWTSGSHAQSAAAALRASGATTVSVLVLARWLKIGWEATTQEWVRSNLTFPDYNPEICPWTRGACP